MISALSGTVLSAGVSSLVIDVSGVGFRVETTTAVVRSARTAEPISLLTELVVREDSLTLFGFTDEVELEMFQALRSVSGVGPKLALAAISELGAVQIVRAVQREDEKTLNSIKGLGPKTAKLIVATLAGRFEHLPVVNDSDHTGSDVTANATSQDLLAEVRLALLSLGWSEKQAMAALREVAVQDAPTNAADLLRAALLRLQGGAR